MASNVRPGGNAESVEVDESVKSGDLVRVGNLAGIAQIDATAGEDGKFYTTLAIEGVARVATTASFSAGDLVGAAGAEGEAQEAVAAGDADLVVGIATRDTGNSGSVWFKIVPNVGA